MVSIYNSRKPAWNPKPNDSRFNSRLDEIILMGGYTKRVKESGRGLNPLGAIDAERYLVTQ